MTAPERKRQIEVKPQGIVVLPARTTEAGAQVGDWYRDDNGIELVYDGARFVRDDKPPVIPGGENVPDEEAALRERLRVIQAARQTELGIELCMRAMNPAHGTKISKISAQDAAEGERSIEIELSSEESIFVFGALKHILTKRRVS